MGDLQLSIIGYCITRCNKEQGDAIRSKQSSDLSLGTNCRIFRYKYLYPNWKPKNQFFWDTTIPDLDNDMLSGTAFEIPDVSEIGATNLVSKVIAV